MAEVLLQLNGVTMRFGGVTALGDVTLHVDQGEIFGLIGPNGAGKTTVFNAVTGVYPAHGRGDHLRGQEPRGIEPQRDHTSGHRAHVPEHPPVPRDDRPRERDGRRGRPPPHQRHAAPSSASVAIRREERDGRERGMELLEFMGIARRADEASRNLPYGDQRRLEIARAMATNPRLLLLDEPAAGFNPAEKRDLMDLILRDPRPRVHGAADRARHEPRDGHLRPNKRLGLRQTDRRGDARRGPGEPRRDRGLPGSAIRCFLSSPTCTCSTGASRPSRASRSTWTKARS